MNRQIYMIVRHRIGRTSQCFVTSIILPLIDALSIHCDSHIHLPPPVTNATGTIFHRSFATITMVTHMRLSLSRTCNNFLSSIDAQNGTQARFSLTLSRQGFSAGISNRRQINHFLINGITPGF